MEEDLQGATLLRRAGGRKTDDNAYRAAIEEFERWRAKIDLETDAAKPYRAEYEQAIKLRQAMLDWYRTEGLETRTPDERAEYDQLAKEIAKLNSDFGRLSPPTTQHAWTIVD